MNRYLFPMAFWLYLSLDRTLQGVGRALYFDHGWEMTFIWLVSIVFLGIVGTVVWRDPQQRAMLLAPPRNARKTELAWDFLLLCAFTAFLFYSLGDVQRWWQASWVDLWFKILLAALNGAAWIVAGRWWRDALQAALQNRPTSISSSEVDR